jgi:hypothetical protein
MRVISVMECNPKWYVWGLDRTKLGCRLHHAFRKGRWRRLQCRQSLSISRHLQRFPRLGLHQPACVVVVRSAAGAAEVSQLMCSAASHVKSERDSRSKPCIIASLCSLTAAQALSAGSITAVLYCSIDSGRSGTTAFLQRRTTSAGSCWHQLRPLLQLPNVKQMSTQCLFGLIKAAVAAGAHDMVTHHY